MPDDPAACAFCEAADTIPLPDPAPSHSVLSDLRVLPLALAKRACRRCGYAWRPPLDASPDITFGPDYQLGAGPPTAADAARHRRYAAWIAAAIDASPASVVDVGCGNGGLLLAMREQWPSARLSGVDPSPHAAHRARAAGLDVEVAAAEGADLRGRGADLAVTVNVIEHTADPRSFLRQLAASLGPDGQAVIVCPDGGAAGLELVFLDHLHSLTAPHLAMLCIEAGLRPHPGSASGPPGFQMMLASRMVSPVRSTLAALHGERLATLKSRYLQRWRDLDDRLAERLHGCGDVVCFGVGEAAGLLRGYAPASWARVRACTLDGDGPRECFGLPVRPLAEIRADGAAMLVAVNPLDQAAVAARLAAESRSPVVTWADLLQPDD